MGTTAAPIARQDRSSEDARMPGACARRGGRRGDVGTLRVPLATLILLLAACGDAEGGGGGNVSAAPADDDPVHRAEGELATAEGEEPPYGWAYAADGERGGPEALYGVVQGESFLAITCDGARRVLRVTALGIPEQAGGSSDRIRAGDVRGEFPVRWEPVEYAGEAAWDRISEIPLDHPLAAALARHRGAIVFETTASGEPAEVASDDPVRRVAGDCRSG